jgi:hypothetical protein
MKQEKTMTAWIKTIGNAFATTFGESPDKETGLVRMFRIEYEREYRNLRRLGVRVNDAFVREYLANNRSVTKSA